ncbi:unnamed protein product [Chrysoparadoxa australica]
MPRSKRDKKVSLTKTKGKGHPLKQELIDQVRQAVDKHQRVFVFSFHNLRTKNMKQVRLDFRESRFFMGKNKVMQLALGHSPEDEYKDNLRHVSRLIKGHCGLLCTDRPVKEVEQYFSELAMPEFASSGFVPSTTIEVPEGVLEEWPISMMEQLRKLGLIVEIKDSKLVNRSKFKMAKEGVPLTPEQAKLLVGHASVHRLLISPHVNSPTFITLPTAGWSLLAHSLTHSLTHSPTHSLTHKTWLLKLV